MRRSRVLLVEGKKNREHQWKCLRDKFEDNKGEKHTCAPRPPAQHRRFSARVAGGDSCSLSTDSAVLDEIAHVSLHTFPQFPELHVHKYTYQTEMRELEQESQGRREN